LSHPVSRIVESVADNTSKYIKRKIISDEKQPYTIEFIGLKQQHVSTCDRSFLRSQQYSEKHGLKKKAYKYIVFLNNCFELKDDLSWVETCRCFRDGISVV